MLFCDDIRREVSNKISISGVFNDRIFVESFPAALPKLAIYGRVLVPHDWDGDELRVVLRTEGRKDENVGTIPREMIEGARGKAAASGIPHVTVAINRTQAPFAIDTERLYVTLLKDGDDEVVCGAMRISLKEETKPKPAPRRAKPKMAAGTAGG